MPLDAYDEGWSYYVDPYNIGGEAPHEFEETLETAYHKDKQATGVSPIFCETAHVA